MLFSSRIIPLLDLEPITKGTRRSIYQLPGQPDLIIKVATPGKVEPPDRLPKRIIRRLMPGTRFRNILVEAQYEMEVALRLGKNAPESPLPKSLGVVATDLGVGVAVERITDGTGTLAKTLRQLAQDKPLTPALLQHLNRFATKMYEMQIIAGDLHEGNIVFGQRNGRAAMFLVDGFGERHAIPIRSWFRPINDRSLDRRMQRMATGLGLVWQADRRQFQFSPTN